MDVFRIRIGQLIDFKITFDIMPIGIYLWLDTAYLKRLKKLIIRNNNL